MLESAPEDLELKRELFTKLDEIVARGRDHRDQHVEPLDHASWRRSRSRPGHFVGMHFFNPVPAMKLVEIVAGLQHHGLDGAPRARASPRTSARSPIDVKDSPGFVVNRVLFPMINEAAFALQEQVADAKGIDECMKLGCNHPMGPLALADLVGLDVVLRDPRQPLSRVRRAALPPVPRDQEARGSRLARVARPAAGSTTTTRRGSACGPT